MDTRLITCNAHRCPQNWYGPTNNPKNLDIPPNGVEIFPFLCENGDVRFSFIFVSAMKRSAFTLIELLVVIAVIALLIAILIPAIGASREAARRNQCINRQRTLAIAMVDYNNGNNGLPGYLNQFGEMPVHSWVVSVFPMIGENQRYETLMKGLTPPEALASLPALLCPSDNPRDDGRLNYVVNCGPVASDGMDGGIVSAFILFKDRRAGLTAINKKVKIEEIPNGASNTVLLSERLDAGVWHAVDWAAPDELEVGAGSGIFTRSYDAVTNFGFLWLLPDSPIPDFYPRPSSKHPGTVITAYADGTAKPMNDDIDEHLYLKAVCVDSDKVRLLLP